MSNFKQKSSAQKLSVLIVVCVICLCTIVPVAPQDNRGIEQAGTRNTFVAGRDSPEELHLLCGAAPQLCVKFCSSSGRMGSKDRMRRETWSL